MLILLRSSPSLHARAVARQPMKRYYCGQGGLVDWTWGELKWFDFVFSDSLQAGFLHVGCRRECQRAMDRG